MYLNWIDYGVLILLLIFSVGIGIYQGFGRSKQTSTKEFLVADGRMTYVINNYFGCNFVNVTPPSITNQSSNVLISLFSISPLWFVFIGVSITVIFGLIFSFVLDSKDSKPIDPALVVSRQEIFPCCSPTKQTMKRPVAQKNDEHSMNDIAEEQEIML